MITKIIWSHPEACLPTFCSDIQIVTTHQHATVTALQVDVPRSALFLRWLSLVGVDAYEQTWILNKYKQCTALACVETLHRSFTLNCSRNAGSCIMKLNAGLQNLHGSHICMVAAHRETYNALKRYLKLFPCNIIEAVHT